MTLTYCCFSTLTEKDVSRTDRVHKFFQGEDNPNIAVLYDILMTHCMFNFDLGNSFCFVLGVLMIEKLILLLIASSTEPKRVFYDLPPTALAPNLLYQRPTSYFQRFRPSSLYMHCPTYNTTPLLNYNIDCNCVVLFLSINFTPLVSLTMALHARSNTYFSSVLIAHVSLP